MKLMKNDNFHRKKKSSDYLVKVRSPWKNQASLIEKGSEKSFYSCGRDKLYLICSKLLPSLSQKSNVLLHCLEPNASTYYILLYFFLLVLLTRKRYVLRLVLEQNVLNKNQYSKLQDQKCTSF